MLRVVFSTNRRGLKPLFFEVDCLYADTWNEVSGSQTLGGVTRYVFAATIPRVGYGRTGARGWQVTGTTVDGERVKNRRRAWFRVVGLKEKPEKEKETQA